MSNVVEFPGRTEAGKNLTGTGKCLQCGHEWGGAVAPIGEPVSMVCPLCGLHHGVFVGLVEPVEGELFRVCNCGNSHFYIQPAGCFCAKCGLQQYFHV